MTSSEYALIMQPDYKIVYAYNEVPYVFTKNPMEEKISVTLQAVSKDREISRAHGYSVYRRTLKKIIDELENDDNEKEKSEMGLCPFCGSSAHAERNDDGKWYIECIYCGSSTAPLFHSKKEAIRFWNERQ